MKSYSHLNIWATIWLIYDWICASRVILYHCVTISIFLVPYLVVYFYYQGWIKRWYSLSDYEEEFAFQLRNFLSVIKICIVVDFVYINITCFHLRNELIWEVEDFSPMFRNINFDISYSRSLLNILP